MADEWLYVRNWWRFQHYKDRTPPWIKLHRSFFTNPDIAALSDSDKIRLQKLWLLATDFDGRIPNDCQEVEGRLRSGRCQVAATLVPGRSDVARTVLARFEAIGLISKNDVRGSRGDSASPRQRQSREEKNPPNPPLEASHENHRPPRKAKPPAAPFIPPDWIPRESWDGFLEHRKRKGGITRRGMELTVRKLESLRSLGHAPGDVLDQSVMNGWTSVFEIRAANGNGNGHKSFRQQQEDHQNEYIDRALGLSAGKPREALFEASNRLLPGKAH